MIFVTVGSSDLRFDRLVKAAVALELDEPIVVQCGPVSVVDSKAACVDYIDLADFERLVRVARVVVTHAGIGNVALCLRNRRRPVVVPRRRAFGEAADDHQLAFARRLAAKGLAIAVEDPSELGAALVAVPEAPSVNVGLSPALAAELVEYIGRYAPRIRDDDLAASVAR